MGQTKNFKAACLNVDGLPPSISIVGVKVSLNPDGSQEKGSERISELVAQKGWDFFGVSEDFNYHDELISKISDYYNIGTFRGKVSTSNTTLSGGLLKVKTDGLDLMWKKSMTASDETMTAWNKTNGYTSNGADELLLKGYRYYCVTVANGLEVDVYIHHMDAETDAADISARESQINQLVAAIKASDNHRPIIIMGDTNCRYTRDKLKELLIDAINEDERFEIHDPWIDFARDGVYPEYGTESLMTSALGAQKGEVVDKIFYINNSDANGVVLTANSYLHDTDFSYADGTPISDHYPIVIDFTIENTSSNISAASYYLRNVETGEFMCAGSNWGTHAIVGETGNYITLENADAEGQYYLHSTCGYISHDAWMDNAQDVYTISKAASGNYVIKFEDNGATKAFTVKDSKRVEAEEYVENDLSQEWEFLSKEELINELYTATEENPKNATFFIRGANFGRNDSDYSNYWTKNPDSGLTINHDGLDGDIPENNHIVTFYNSADTKWIKTLKSSGTMVQSADGLPNGKYKMSVQAFQYTGNSFRIDANGNYVKMLYREDNASETKLYDKDETTTIDGVTYYIPKLNDIASAASYFNAGLYTTSTDEFTISDHKLTVSIVKDQNTSEMWSAFDNFQLIYLGPTEEDNAAYDKVKKAMDDAQAKATAMNLYNYNNSVVEERYENRQLTGNGDEEVKMTYVALANAAKSQNQIPADMRYAILNNSFEMGDLTYWTADNGSVIADAEAKNADGVYTYNGSSVSQSTENVITMQNGLYELKALLSNGGKLTANGVESEAAVAENGALAEVSVRFPVTAGVISFSATGMECADNFTLTRLGDADNLNGYEMVKAAIADATARVKALGSPYSDDWDLSEYQEKVDNYGIEGSGIVEFNEIYALLREQVAKRVEKEGVNADATDAIINNSFEMGETWGWNITLSSDTGVKENSNSTYTTTGCDGDYLYNTWYLGTPVTQTISGLYPGTYKLTAKVASDVNANIYLFANGNRTLQTITGDKTQFVEVSVEFTVGEDQTVTIGVVGGTDAGEYVEDGYWWYKADDFKLTYIGDGKETVNVQFTHAYRTLILPFSQEIPETMEVYTVDSCGDVSNGIKVLNLTKVDKIAANTPYLIKYVTSTNASQHRAISTTEYDFEGVPSNDENTYTEGLLTGTLVNKTVSNGAFVFDSSKEQFVQLGDNESAEISANYAYIDNEVAQEEEVTIISINDNQISTGIEAVMISSNAKVDVYGVNGVLLKTDVNYANALDGLTEGVYVVRNGSVAIKLVK
jgi:hypothetical protein